MKGEVIMIASLLIFIHFATTPKECVIIEIFGWYKKWKPGKCKRIEH